jgi:hypothetical protein
VAVQVPSVNCCLYIKLRMWFGKRFARLSVSRHSPLNVIILRKQSVVRERLAIRFAAQSFPNLSPQTYKDYACQVLTVPPIERDSYSYRVKSRASPQSFGQLRLRRRAARLSGFGFAAPNKRSYCVVVIKNIVVKGVLGYCPCAFVVVSSWIRCTQNQTCY